MMNYKLSASMICGDQSQHAKNAKELHVCGIDMLHIDVMDGHFVPRFGMYPEQLRDIKQHCSALVNVHMMVTDPEPYLERFSEAGADYITVHYEIGAHVPRVLQKIRKLGCKAGLALNIQTPPSVLEYLLEFTDLVMIMGINPGVLGQEVWERMYEKVHQTRVLCDKNRIGGEKILIEVDGGVKPETSSKLIKHGANILTCGSSTIFRPQEGTIKECINSLRTRISNEL
jgi:ribulose-phosphate 3-epimerase